MGTVVIAVKRPGMQTERDLYELAQIVTVEDRRRWGQPVRDYPGEGLLVIPSLEQDEAEAALQQIDEDWDIGLEILDLDRARIDALLHH